MKTLLIVLLLVSFDLAYAGKNGTLLGPQPQFARVSSSLLDGSWQFAFDGKTILKAVDQNGNKYLLPESGEELGEKTKWFSPQSNAIDTQNRAINVPYPYETKNSGIEKPEEIHTVVWYKKTFNSPRLAAKSALLLRFGAVDYDAKVWVNGQAVGEHRGGHTAFQFDIAPFLNPAGQPNVIVFRAYDDVRDQTQRTGKQRPTEFAIFYKHTTGAWRSITLEKTSATYLEDVQVTWVGDTKTLEFKPTLSQAPNGVRFRVKLYHQDLAGQRQELVQEKIVELGAATTLSLSLEKPRLWFPYSPTHKEWKPNLYHLEYELLADDGAVLDQVTSYTGLKTLRQENGSLFINDEKIVLRGVLNQLYREDTQLAAPEETIKDEVRKILKSGYNFARLHQSFDPRALAWADRMGLLVSAEAPSAELLTPETEDAALNELREIVLESRNHPSLVEIVDTNESWGLRFIDKRDAAYRELFAKDPQAAEAARQFNLDYIQKSLSLRRSLLRSGHSRDGEAGFSLLADAQGRSYGVLLPGNDGWDETHGNNSLHFHRYDHDGGGMTQALGVITQHGAANTPLPAADAQERPYEELKNPYTQGFGYNRTPIYLSEFGGVGYVDHSAEVRPGTWGYAGLERQKRDFALRIHGLFSSVSQLPLAGYTYTQLKRTGFEVNGTLNEYGIPLLPLRLMKAITTIGEYPNLAARSAKVEKMIISYFDHLKDCSHVLDL